MDNNDFEEKPTDNKLEQQISNTAKNVTKNTAKNVAKTTRRAVTNAAKQLAKRMFVILIPVLTKLLIISLIAVIIFVLVCSFLRIIKIEDSKKLSTGIYEELEITEIGELVEIKGSEKEGYHLEFVDDIDEKLEKLIKDPRQKYIAHKINDVELIKKFIRAEIATQFPNLGSTPTGGFTITGGDLKWPTDGTTISSYFGLRDAPIAGASTNHGAIDIAVDEGTNVYACESGQVTFAGYNGNAGNMITIDHGNGYTSTYMHNSELRVSSGDIVEKGQIIALSGNTGNSTGPHLHFQIQLNGEKVDPLSFKYENGIGDGTSGFGKEEDTETEENGKSNQEEKNKDENNKNDKKDEKDNENEEFQGAVRLRRVTPNKAIGEFKDTDAGKTEIDNNQEIKEGMGKQEEIPEDVKKQMREVSLPEGSLINFDDLAYLTIPYVNFEGEIRQGHMVVNKNAADDVLNIFQELYSIKYPIEKMELIDKYYDEETMKGDLNALDTKSCDENNTSAFCYRDSTGGTELSNHALGLAIDLNPRINPYVQDGQTSHENAKKFVERDPDKWENVSQAEKDAFIGTDTKVYKIFEKYGWTWGGNWENPKDYQHFEKVYEEDSETKETSINSKIYDLSYVPEDKFNEYVENNDPIALELFTLNENMEAVIASWSYTTDEGVKITKSSSLDYRSALSKYTMPYEYLTTMAANSDDPDFCEDLAELAIDSEYIVAIEDKVSTTQTVVRTNWITEYYRYNSSGEGSQQQYLFTDDTMSQSEIDITEHASQTVEVTYVDSWFVKYYKEITFSSDMTASGGGGTYLTGEKGKYLGKFKITAYCNCSICCGQWAGGPTSSGKMPVAGRTVACNVLPEGTNVMFNDHVYCVEDTGTGLPGNWIDLYMDSHEEALAWGVQNLDVYEATNVKELSSTDDNQKEENKQDSENKENNNEEEENSNKNQSVNTVMNITGTVTKTSSQTVEVQQGIVSAVDANGQYTITDKVITTTTSTISTSYSTGNSKVMGNSEKFQKIYEKAKHKNNIYVPWLAESLEEIPKTANLVDVTKYLFYQADHSLDYGVQTLDFSEYEPGSFQKVSYGNIGYEFVKSWENDHLRLFLNGETDDPNAYGVKGYVTADRSKFICYDDGSGGGSTRNYGFGVCHYSANYGYHEDKIPAYQEASGGAINITEAQYNQVGTSTIDVAIVNKVGENEYNNDKEIVKQWCAEQGITMKEHEINVLADMVYQGYSAKAKQICVYYKNNDMASIRSTILSASYGGTDYSNQRAQARWIAFSTGEYYGANGEKIEMASGGGDIISKAEEIHRYMEENKYAYCTFGQERDPSHGGNGGAHGLNSTFEESKTGYHLTCCATYVSWVLYECGYTECAGIHNCTSLEAVLSPKAQRITDYSQLQAGDIVFWPGGAHVQIYAGDDKWYNAGSTNAIQRTDTPYTDTSVAGKFAFALRLNQ